jgi:hypothetical protein
MSSSGVPRNRALGQPVLIFFVHFASKGRDLVEAFVRAEGKGGGRAPQRRQLSCRDWACVQRSGENSCAVGDVAQPHRERWGFETQHRDGPLGYQRVQRGLRYYPLLRRFCPLRRRLA